MDDPARFEMQGSTDNDSVLGTFRTCGHVGYQVLSGHRRGWFDMRDLGTVLDHVGSLGERRLTVAAAAKAFHASSCF